MRVGDVEDGERLFEADLDVPVGEGEALVAVPFRKGLLLRPGAHYYNESRSQKPADRF